VVSHATDVDEAAWAARQANLSRTPGRRWSSIAVLTRTNAQLTKVLAAMEAAGVPAAIAGADLGPASDVRGDSRRGARGGPASGGRGVDPDEDDEVEAVPRDHVVLSTFHRAKGLQWQTVLVLGLSGGLMPLASAQMPSAIEEERRLLYVALTRSEDELWCSWFERTGNERGEVERGPSPWLAPIERAIEELDKEAAPVAASEVSSRVAELRRRLAEGVEGTDGPSD
jgi:superfamily I DNA/RNA helicase